MWSGLKVFTMIYPSMLQICMHISLQLPFEFVYKLACKHVLSFYGDGINVRERPYMHDAKSVNITCLIISSDVGTLSSNLRLLRTNVTPTADFCLAWKMCIWQVECPAWQTKIKTFNGASFLGHHRCDKCQTLHDGTIYWAVPVHTTFSDLDHMSKSQNFCLCSYVIRL